MDPYELFKHLGISLLLGLLVGLQREHVATRLAGVRTFPLITVLGTVAALLAKAFGGWVLAAGFIGVLASLLWFERAGNVQPDYDPNTTTRVAALLMYGVGALLTLGRRELEAAVAVGGGVAMLLQFKPQLHGFVHRLGEADVKAIMQFVLITCIILPVLPDETYGPLAVFNPFRTWLLVVLIVGISLGGYIAYKFLGQNAGILLAGILGGAISSTATTVSYSRQARNGPAEATLVASIVIMIASAVVFLRVILLIGIVGSEYLPTMAPPLGVLFVLSLVPALAAWRQSRHLQAALPEPENPTQLRLAVFFAAMYTVVLLALAATRQYLGQRGPEAAYAVAAVSGLTDMDAITLSTVQMAARDPTTAEHGWRLLVVAALANLVFKAGVIGVLGNPRLLRQIGLLFALPWLGGVVLLWLWPL